MVKEMELHPKPRNLGVWAKGGIKAEVVVTGPEDWGWVEGS